MLNLNGKQMPGFVKVESFEFSILPPMQNNMIQVRGKKGHYFYDQQLGQRMLNANIIIKAEANKVIEYTRELAEWLYNPEPVKLVLDEEPDKYYMVVPDGETTINEIVSVGMGTISFVCTEPFAFSVDETEHVFTPAANTPTYVNVGGTAEAYPEIEVTLTQDAESIAVVADNGYVMIGDPASADMTPVNTRPKRLNDEMNSLTGWQAATLVDRGVIAGTFSPSGLGGVQQTSGNYGTGTEWHGASVKKSLSATAQNFEAGIWFSHDSTHRNQTGRVELYLLDANGVHMGKVTLEDFSIYHEYPTFKARAGAAGSGHDIVAGYRGLTSTNKKTKAEVSTFSNFYGRMYIRRNGKYWSAQIGIWDTVKKKFKSTYTRNWIDSKNQFNKPLAAVQIHVGKWGGSTIPATDRLHISNVYVTEIVELSNGQTPIIAEAGDVLTIDCSKSILYKNGEEFYKGLQPGSSFFALQPGVNGLAVTEPGTNVKVTYREGWL